MNTKWVENKEAWRKSSSSENSCRTVVSCINFFPNYLWTTPALCAYCNIVCLWSFSFANKHQKQHMRKAVYFHGPKRSCVSDSEGSWSLCLWTDPQPVSTFTMALLLFGKVGFDELILACDCRYMTTSRTCWPIPRSFINRIPSLTSAIHVISASPTHHTCLNTTVYTLESSLSSVRYVNGDLFNKSTYSSTWGIILVSVTWHKRLWWKILVLNLDIGIPPVDGSGVCIFLMKMKVRFCVLLLCRLTLRKEIER